MQMPQERLQVVVVFGGRSPEHGVSCMSAAGLISGLNDRYEVTPIGIGRTGGWYRMPTDTDAVAGYWSAVGDPSYVDTFAAEHPESVQHYSAPEIVRLLGTAAVVFPVLHGRHGEDGRVQGLFDLLGVPYVGCDPDSGSRCLDKDVSKTLLLRAGLPVGEFATIRDDYDLAALDRDRIGLPAFVKPARCGSSIGITRISDWEHLPAAVETARKYDRKVLVETETPGREISCGVLESEHGGPPDVTVPTELVDNGFEWLDFDAKYFDANYGVRAPAPLPTDLAAQISDLCRRTFSVLECRGMARVDVFLSPGGTVQVNEVNTFPAFGPQSLFVQAWAASGLPYDELIARLIRTGRERRLYD